MTSYHLSDQQTDRQGWIMTLRVLAAMAIVLIHVAGWGNGSWLDNTTEVRLVVDGVIGQTLVRWAVPCFLMISGALLLNPRKDIGLKRIYWYILRMVIVLATFGFGFCIIESLVNNGYQFNGAVILSALRNLIAGHSWDHMWYVYMLIGLYILTPVLRAFTKKADGKEMAVLLGMLLAFTIFVPTLSKLLHIKVYRVVPVSTYCVFYYLLGHYLSVHRFKTAVKWMLLAGGALGFVGMLLLKLWGADVSLAGDNFFAAIYSAGIFSFSIENRFLERWAKYRIVQSLAKCSFGIYLLHPVFLNILNKGLGIFPDFFPIVVGEFLFWLAGFGGAYLVTFVLCKIKFVRKILA